MSEDKAPRSECVLEMRDIIHDNLSPINASLQEVTAELCRLSSYQIQANEQMKQVSRCVERHDNLLVGESGGNGLNSKVISLGQSRDNLRKGLYALWALLGSTAFGKVIFELFNHVEKSQ